VKPDYESQSVEGCRQVSDEEVEEALSDYEAAEVTSKGQYRCRDCGMLFDTLEEHEMHHRKIHGHTEVYSLAGPPM
jgi:hypothetical protein